MNQIAKRLFCICFLFPILTFGQKYLTKDIKSKADSILKIYIGDSIFKNHCTFDSNTYYEYVNIFGETDYETLTKFKKTKGKFVKVQMRWHVSFLFNKCSVVRIGDEVLFELDKKLQPLRKPDLDFVPDFYWQNDSCHLISREEAILIAKSQKLKPGIDSLVAHINYDTKTKTYLWHVSHRLTKKTNAFNHDYGTTEEIIIDASTKKIILIRELYYGPVY